jgi:cytochrome c peroxidase
MSRTKHFPRVVALAWKRPKMWGAGAAVVLATILASVTVAGAAIVLFGVFKDDTGTVQTQSSDPTTLNASNAFFDPSIGTNGQACVTCHQPSVGITISVDFINRAFNATSGGTGPLDPLFRPNDTANNPHTNSLSKNPADYSLILNLGVVRIGKTVPTGAAADFTVVAADAETNTMFAAPDHFPLTTDPQHFGTPTLSVFRRPLVNTNVNFDSSVLWDGRADISNMPAQVNGAIQTLLLGPGGDPEVNGEIADFMTGVFTDQTSSNVAGGLTALGATGGVHNLLALSESPSRPCVFDEDTPPDLTPFVAAVATPTTCTPVVAKPNSGTFNLFESWTNLPNIPGQGGRLSIARGQVVFNTASANRAGGFGCVSCHSVNNLGNNAQAGSAGFFNIGTDSLATLAKVKAGGFLTPPAKPTAAEAQMVQDMIDRVNQLPLYCLRPKTDMSGTPCGSQGTDVVTTDPGRALVTGLIVDSGKFKPPILRNLGVRSPYYHAGAAPSIEHLINYYDLRFNLQLTDQEKADLANFIDTGL